MTGALGSIAPGGEVSTLVIPRPVLEVAHEYPLVITDKRRLDKGAIIEFGHAHSRLPEWLRSWRASNRRNLDRGLDRALLADRFGIPTIFGALFASKITKAGDVLPFGLVSMRVITDAGVAAISDSFNNTFENELFNFHGMGTGTTAEAASQTALVTELTTEYNPNSTRATGTQTTPTNVYQTIGTNTIDSGTPAVTEHGIFSQAATGGGTMLDRSVFAAINLVSGDGIQFTYQLTLTSGG